MDHDLIFTLGCVFVFFGIPALVSGYSEQRLSLFGLFLVIAGIAGAGFVVAQDPSRYELAALPEIFLQVFARFFA